MKNTPSALINSIKKRKWNKELDGLNYSLIWSDVI